MRPPVAPNLLSHRRPFAHAAVPFTHAAVPFAHAAVPCGSPPPPRSNGWRNIAFLNEDINLFTMMTDTFILEQKTPANMDDPIDVVVNAVFQQEGTTGELNALVETKLQQIYDSGVRIWVINAYPANVRKILKIASKIGLTGEGYQILLGGNVGESRRGALARACRPFSSALALLPPLFTHANITLTPGNCVLYNPACPGKNGETTSAEDDPEIVAAAKGAIATLPHFPVGNPEYDMFVSKMVDLLDLADSSEVNSYAAGAYEAVYAYAYAVHTFEESYPGKDILGNPDDFQSHLKGIRVPSGEGGVLGEISFDANGDRESAIDVLNFDGGANENSNGFWAASHKWSAQAGLEAKSDFKFFYTGGTTTKPINDMGTVAVASAGIPVMALVGVGIGLIVVVAIAMVIVQRAEQKSKNLQVREAPRARRAQLVHTYPWPSSNTHFPLQMGLNSVVDELVSVRRELAMTQEYNEKEINMIEDGIDQFKKEFAKKGEAAHEGKDESGPLTEETVGDSLARFLISEDDIEPHEIIGKGSFGDVFRAQYKGQQCAVKTMKQVDVESMQRFREEILLMSDLFHDNIVRMLGAVWDSSLMALVLEFCENGSSMDYLEVSRDSEEGAATWESPVYKWVLGVTQGMKYLHSVSFWDSKSNSQVQNLIHRDIKPDNMLVSASLNVKIADFGEARTAMEGTMTMVGTPLFVSPEVIRGDRYGVSCDVYGFGMLLLAWTVSLARNEKLGPWLINMLWEEHAERELATGGGKGPEPTLAKISYQMIEKGWRPNMAGLAGFPKSVVDIIGICLEDNPEVRPDFTEAEDYVKTVMFKELFVQQDLGTERSGTARRASSGGANLQAKIVTRQQEVQEGVGREQEVDMREVAALRQKVKALEIEVAGLKGA